MCPPTPPHTPFPFTKKESRNYQLNDTMSSAITGKRMSKMLKRRKKINCENSQTMVIIILAAQGGLWRGLSGLMSVITLGKTRKLGEGMRCAYYRAVMMAKISIDNTRM